MDKLFGTDGIRGKVGVYPLTEEMICKIGKAVSIFIKNTNPHKRRRQRISIAKDTRTTGDMFEEQLIKGITSEGVDIVKLGILPTPCTASLVKMSNHDMGVVVSASHNDISDNGLKFFTHKGYKLTPAEEKEIERIVFSGTADLTSASEGDGLLPAHPEDGTEHIAAEGKVKDEKDSIPLYIGLLKEIIAGVDLNNYKIVVDCAHGPISFIIPHLKSELGMNIVSINNTPNGSNINDGAGSLYPNVVSDFVIKEKCDCGFAFDGDGDRVIACDEKGQVLDGDFILAIIAKYLIEKGKLNKNSIVTTQMSNLGLEMCVSQWGGRLIKTDVGDKFVLEKMLKGKLNLGGEQSGHIILLDHTTTGDGLLTALYILKIMSEEGKSLGELARCMYKFPQILVNVEVGRKKPLEELPKLKKAMERIEKKLGAKGRLYVRYSGTENKLRIMIEGQNQLQIKELAEEIACAAKEEIDA
ncbi:MAG: phosphoglucosamine mutase [Candidatus Omnitrophota bacterium]